MRYDPEQHRRRSIRLPAYDYAASGAYFLTICTADRECWLATVEDGEARLTVCGQVVAACWASLPSRFEGVDTDVVVFMPNHVHAVVWLCGGGSEGQWDREAVAPHVRRTGPALGQVVRTFKAVSTRRVRAEAEAAFGWQRNYWEHVIRDESELSRIRTYIAENPARWAVDAENPDRL